MAYDEALDVRIAGVAAGWKGSDSKKMFAGVCHLVNGNMVCGMNKDSLILPSGGSRWRAGPGRAVYPALRPDRQADERVGCRRSPRYRDG